MYCHLTPADATAQHFQLNIFPGLKSELQMTPMPFHLESLWGATLMPHKGCAMDCNKTKIVKVGKTSGPILSRLWTKVRKILRQRMRPFALSNALARLSVSRFVQQIFAIKCRSRRKKRTNVKVFWHPIFFGRDDPNFSTAHCYSGLLLTVWQSVVEFRLLISVCKAWQWSGMRNLHRIGKNAGQVWSCLWTKVHDILRQCRRLLAVVNALDRLSISSFVPKI